MAALVRSEGHGTEMNLIYLGITKCITKCIAKCISI